MFYTILILPGINLKSACPEIKQGDLRFAESEGIETYLEELNTPYLEKTLEKYNPDETIIFNLCETLPGIPNSEKRVRTDN